MQIQGKYRCISCFNELNSETEKCSCGFDEEKYRMSPHILSPGTILNGAYCVGRVLGEGGFGITYAGYDINLEMRIAIKEFYLNGYNSRVNTVSNELSVSYGDVEQLFETQKAKFVYEARNLAKLNNEDGIVNVYNFFMANNTAYIVMEYLDGQTLKEYLDTKGKLSVDEMFKIFMPIIGSLDKVHEVNLMHRDISPDNIIFTKNGKIKILDFGAARENSNGNKSLSVVLKHGYAPMEQYQTHGKQGPWTDVYALSATIYKCITGSTPATATDRAMGEIIKSPCEIVDDCPKAVSDVVMKGLELQIDNRYQSMKELAAAFNNAKDTMNGKLQSVEPFTPVAVPVHKEEKPVMATSKQEAQGNISVAPVQVGQNPVPVMPAQYEQRQAPVTPVRVGQNSVPVVAGQAYQANVNPVGNRAETKNVKKKKTGKVLGIIAILVALIAISSGATIFFLNRSSTERENDARSTRTERTSTKKAEDKIEEKPEEKPTNIKEETKAEEQVEVPAVVENVAEEPVTINIMRPTFNIGSPDSTQVKKVENAINDYISDKINVQISLTDLGYVEYTDKANFALANNKINLLWTASWEYMIGTNDLVSANAVYDLTDIIQGSTLYKTMEKGQWEASKYNGKNYFIPVYKDNVEGYDFMFRKDLVDKHGWDITSVNSLADLEPMLKDAKADGLKYPLLTQKTAMFYRWYINDFDFFTADASVNWVSVDRASNSVVNTIATPQYKEFCELMAKYAAAGYVSKDEVTKTTTDTITQTQDWAISWWTDIPVNAEANSRYGQEVVMQPATNRWAHSASNLGSCYCVTANSTAEQAQACIDFMGLLYTDSKLADIYTFGIEGEDFTYDANGQVTQTSEKYNHSMWESVSATVVTPLDNEPANKAKIYKEYNSNSNTSCAAGFHFDVKPVEAQYTACKSVFEKYGYVLENGGVAPKDVDATIAKYQAALDSVGYQEVLAEFQKQYDDWKKYYR